MSEHDDIETRIKKILKQVSGNVRNSDGALIPEVAIRGKGILYCYSPAKKRYISVTRGLKAYIITEKLDEMGKILIYTFTGHIVEIEPHEILHTGCD